MAFPDWLTKQLDETRERFVREGLERNKKLRIANTYILARRCLRLSAEPLPSVPVMVELVQYWRAARRATSVANRANFPTMWSWCPCTGCYEIRLSRESVWTRVGLVDHLKEYYRGCAQKCEEYHKRHGMPVRMRMEEKRPSDGDPGQPAKRLR